VLDLERSEGESTLPKSKVACMEMKGLVMPIITKFLFINLKESTERRQYMSSMLGGMSLPFGVVEATRPQEKEWKENIAIDEPGRLDVGAYGVWKGHQKAWQAALDGGHAFTMVMEDDIVLPGDYNYSHWSIAVPKDAHIIFLNTYVLEAPGDLRSTVYGAVPLGPKQSCPGEL
jgi:hypothetical protein